MIALICEIKIIKLVVFKLIAISFVVGFTSFIQAAEVIVVPPWGAVSEQQNRYISKLLQLALDKTKEEGVIRVEQFPRMLTLARSLAYLKADKRINVVWTGTNSERERDFLPIYFPLLQELNEYRVLLIRKEDEEAFSRVKTLGDLQRFTAGACPDWPSTDVLERNKLPLIKVKNADLLFPMLEAKRFDYISRSIFEVWGEVNTLSRGGIVVEKKLMLHDGVQFYFFVNRNNKTLAQRVERGLRLALVDGDFERMFGAVLGAQQGREMLNTESRILLKLVENKVIE